MCYTKEKAPGRGVVLGIAGARPPGGAALRGFGVGSREFGEEMRRKGLTKPLARGRIPVASRDPRHGVRGVMHRGEDSYEG